MIGDVQEQAVRQVDDLRIQNRQGSMDVATGGLNERQELRGRRAVNRTQDDARSAKSVRKLPLRKWPDFLKRIG